MGVPQRAGATGRDGAHVRDVTGTADVDALVGLFEAVAAEEGWRPGGELRAHRDHSAYFAAHSGDRLAGGLQLVLPSEALPLPCHAVWPEAAAVGGPCAAEVLILALLPEYRGRHGLLWPLCVAMWRFCADQGIETLLLEATPGTLAVYRRLGFPLEVVGELREHWGEPCHLCRMGVAEVAGALEARAARSRTYADVLALARPNIPTCPDTPAPASPEGAAPLAPRPGA